MQPLNRYAITSAIVLCILVTAVYWYAVPDLWFREDDLGTILNGLIHSWQDATRVLLADCRSFIVAVNYQRTIPNVVSGFLRPIQNIVFTIVHALYGCQAYPYYITQVLAHATNASLLLLLFARLMPLWIAAMCGMAFAFYPEVTWLTWIGTLQNSLSTLFVLCAAHVYLPELTTGRTTWQRQLATCILFLTSLLSRETAFFIPAVALLAWLLLCTNKSQGFFTRIIKAVGASWPFWVAALLYLALRLCAFGVDTLPRTFNNLFLRYPTLIRILPTSLHPTQITPDTPRTSTTVPKTTATHPVKQQQTESYLHKIYTRAVAWTQALTNIPCTPDSMLCNLMLALLCALCALLIYGYQGHMTLLFLLVVLCGCTMWPGILVYPAARYINLLYPCALALVAGAMTFLSCAPEKYKHFYADLLATALALLCVHGAYTNVLQLGTQSAASLTYQERFDQFFDKNIFAPETNFVVLGSPFVSDVASIFASYIGIRSANVAHELFCTLAEYGSMGCWGPYRSTGVPSNIEPIPNGFRFRSQDPEQCAWWIHFSDFPIAWNANQRAYAWTAEPYKLGIWYPCSLGRFMINNVHHGHYITDLSIELDKSWTQPGTVFVGWDSMKGQYILLDGTHLIG